MILKIIKILKRVLGCRLLFALKVLLHGVPKNRNCRFFDYDCERFYSYSGVAHPDAEETLVSSIICFYHILEKGLTMPQRKDIFGVDIVDNLMLKIQRYESRFGYSNPQVNHDRDS